MLRQSFSSSEIGPRRARLLAIMPGVTDDGLWYAMPTLTESRIRLEPLTLEHAPGYLAAVGGQEQAAEIFRWQSPPGGGLTPPSTVEDARGHIIAALTARARGVRLPYAHTWRDTVVYSMVDDDWPDAKRPLAARLAG